MKENKNNTYRRQIPNNRIHIYSIIERFIFSVFSFQMTNFFQSSKTLSEKLPIRFANIRV